MAVSLSIIIVNWNSVAFLTQCLKSIYKHPPDVPYEIIVIDSASFDGCADVLREGHPGVRFFQSLTNIGFAKANNLASAKCTGEYLLFLNPDTELVGQALDGLLTCASSLPDAGVVGGRLINSDGTVQSSCIQSVPTIANQFFDSEFLRDRWPTSALWGMAPLYDTAGGNHEVAAVSGACILIKRRTFELVGGFTEEYFMYAEDIDLSCKVRKAGYRNYYVSDVSVIHHGGGSSEQAVSAFSAVMMREATWRFFRTTRGGLYALGYRASMTVAAAGRLALVGCALLYEGPGPDSTHRRASLRKWYGCCNGVLTEMTLSSGTTRPSRIILADLLPFS